MSTYLLIKTDPDNGETYHRIIKIEPPHPNYLGYKLEESEVIKQIAQAVGLWDEDDEKALKGEDGELDEEDQAFYDEDEMGIDKRYRVEYLPGEVSFFRFSDGTSHCELTRTLKL